MNILFRNVVGLLFMVMLPTVELCCWCSESVNAELFVINDDDYEEILAPYLLYWILKNCSLFRANTFIENSSIVYRFLLKKMMKSQGYIWSAWPNLQRYSAI